MMGGDEWVKLDDAAADSLPQLGGTLTAHNYNCNGWPHARPHARTLTLYVGQKPVVSTVTFISMPPPKPLRSRHSARAGRQAGCMGG